MSRLTLVLPLLCAVALRAGNAVPYSKISDSVQYGDSFISQKSAASSLSSSYSQAGNRVYSGSQASAYGNSADSHSASSSYSSASVPVGLVSGGDSNGQIGYGGQVASSYGAQAGSTAQVSSGGKGALPYWWMGSDGPFVSGGKASSGGGCTSNGCLASTSYQSSVYSAGSQKETKLKSNPFLHGSSAGASQHSAASSASLGFASSHSGASANSLQQGSAYGASKNPFFSASSSNNYGSAANNAQSNHASGGSSYDNSGFSGYDQAQQVSGGAGNPFIDQQVPQLTQIGDETISQFPAQPVPIPQQNDKDNGLFKISCSGQDQICVPFHLCSYQGFVTAKGLTQVRSGPQECDTNLEACCTLKSEDQASAGSSSGGIFGNGNGNHQQQPDLSTGDISNVGGVANDAGAETNGYLPPIGGSPSNPVPDFTDLPKEPEQETSGASNSPGNIFPPPASPPLQVGCAAALLCVEEKFCTLEGVISTEPQTFSSEQLIRRVPMSDCKNPDNGIIGKCCRDPNYVDPWPAGNLPANYSGGFDEQGFPTILNLSKTRPTKKRPINGGAVNGPRPGIKTSYTSPVGIKTAPRPSPPVFAQQNNYPKAAPIAAASYNEAVESQKPSIPQQQPQQPQQPYDFSQPFVLRPAPKQPPHIFISPEDSPKPDILVPAPKPFAPQQQPQQPQQPFVPQQQPQRPPLRYFPPQSTNTLPLPKPFAPQQQPQQQPQPPYVKNAFAVSSSNQNPAIIGSHPSGVQCGRRNVVQRPNGLTDVDVAFGEIPWQAMVLSTADRKLLCSGAIVAPNAVVTAARCVEGLNPGQVAIKTGEWKLGYELKHEEPLPFEIINVASIAPYSAFSSGNPANEIAILFLEHDMKLDQHVGPLCLPEGQPQPPQSGRKCIATGWGKTVLQVNVAGALMHSIDVDVMNNEQCLERISNAENQIPLDDNLFCGKAHRRNNNMCQVDFGGPLACDRGDGSYELVGIYNQDTGCLPTNQVATFSTIPTQWIENMMANPPQQPPLYDYSPQVSSEQKQFVHSHGPNVPCDCEGHELLPAGSSQYLPPV